MPLGSGHIWLLLILLVIVLIVWGPGKLPDVGAGLGRAIREFRNASQETKDSFTKAASGEQPAPPVAPVAPTPVAPAAEPPADDRPTPH